jgi:WhiB family transcriptional regulator, redox-sensing transcriptional regulator
MSLEVLAAGVLGRPVTLPDRAWMPKGSCRGMDPGFFFPEDLHGVLRAKKVCRACPVRNECLEYALAHGENEGMWGGESERERGRILRAREAQSMKRSA